MKIIRFISISVAIGFILIPIINGNNINDDAKKLIIFFDPETPEPPIIKGPAEGRLNIRYTYEITSNDPQCDNICYTILFSDMPVIYNSKFCESGETLICNHSWDDFYQTKPPYLITAKATDCKGYESEWSTFEMSIPRNKIHNIHIFKFLIRFASLKDLFNL